LYIPYIHVFTDNETEIVMARVNITSQENQIYTHEQRRNEAIHECKAEHASHAICLCEARRSTFRKSLQLVASELFTLEHVMAIQSGLKEVL
jgi:hypothetical protein